MLGTKSYLRLPEEIAGAAFRAARSGPPSISQVARAVRARQPRFTQQQDPAQTLQYLRAASTGVEEAGSATVRGVETTRYIGRLDFQKALDAGLEKLELPAAERQKARKGMKWMLDQMGSKSVPFEVFVDGDGLLRRMTMHMSMKIEGEQITMAMRMDYFDFGVDVDVEAPPAGDVSEVTGLLQP